MNAILRVARRRLAEVRDALWQRDRRIDYLERRLREEERRADNAEGRLNRICRVKMDETGWDPYIRAITVAVDFAAIRHGRVDRVRLKEELGRMAVQQLFDELEKKG